MSDQTKIRGGNQIQDLTITNQQIATDAAIETGKLAEGQEFLKRDGSVPLTGDLDAGGNKIENVDTPVADQDLGRKIDIEQGDANIQSNLDQAESDRIAADEALDIRIDNLNTKDLEQDNRLDLLESDINNAESNLNSEQLNRELEDTNLENQILAATNGSVVNREVPSGIINGTNTTFVLSNNPNLNSEEVYINGIRLIKGLTEDYTINNNTITLSVAPSVDDVILVNYNYGGIIFSTVQGEGTDLSGVQADIADAQADVLSLDSRIDVIEPEIDTLQSEIVSIDSRVDFLEENGVPVDLTELEQDVQDIDTRLDTEELNISNLQNDITNLENRALSAENTFNSLSPVATSGSYNDLLNLPSLAGMSVDWQYFGSSGTWTKPANAKLVYVICIGGGGGGGSGRRGATSTNAHGGLGGAGGSVALGWFHASQLSNTETVTVGLGGAGGSAVTTGIANGNPGSPGGASFFGGISSPNCKLASSAVNGGPGGSTSTGTRVTTTSLNTMFTTINNQGGNSNGSQPPNTYDNGAFYTQHGPAGGAAGGVVNSTNGLVNAGRRNLLERNFGYVPVVSGQVIGTTASYTFDATTGGNSPAGGNGANGLNATTDGSSLYLFGGGAAGGIGGHSVSGGTGGSGGTPGGGGAGGGASRDTVGLSSGAGGSGGNGGVYVITYY